LTNHSEITEAVRAAHKAVEGVKGDVDAAREQASELMEEAAAHGWEGVAATMQQAVEALEAVATSLNAVEDSLGTALGSLGEITSKLSSGDVAQRLEGTAREFEEIRSGVEVAAGSLNDAVNAAAQAEANSLSGMLQGVSDQFDGLRQILEDVKNKTGEEGQAAENWGN
jgi:archaellum component FlaC